MADARQTLLDLIFAAPGPGGIFNNPQTDEHYFQMWDKARDYLRETCPNHIVDGSGTCPNCHGDTAE